MKILLAAGGRPENWPPLMTYDKYIGIDRGALFLLQHQRPVDLAIGDFDSLTAGELQAAKEVTATVEKVDADEGSLVVSVGFGEKSREQKYKLSADTAIVNGMNQLKEVESLKQGLQSVLFEPGTRVRIATLTDKQGITEVLEVRITGRALFRRK